MKQLLPLFAIFAACDDAPPTARNPPVLWLAPDGAETEVKLIDHEPPPY